MYCKKLVYRVFGKALENTVNFISKGPEYLYTISV